MIDNEFDIHEYDAYDVKSQLQVLLGKSLCEIVVYWCTDEGYNLFMPFLMLKKKGMVIVTLQILILSVM